jgi:putative ABC transport system permease protein
MLKLLFANLVQRPTRTLVSVLAVSLAVVLVLVSVGLSYGNLNDSAERTRRIGGDFMFQPSDASLYLALNSGTLPVAIKRVIEDVDGVYAATPVLSKFVGDKFHLVFGIDKESFQRVNSTLKFRQGRLFQGPFEVIIDNVYANTRDLALGDTFELLGRDFTISGIYEAGTAARVLIPLPTLQELNGTPEKATMFFIRAEQGVSLSELHQRLMERFRGYKIIRTAELPDLMASNTPVFRQFVIAVVAISIVISFLIILLSMYSTITERTREIGILKSLGASKSYIIKLILRESLLICGGGIALGFVLTFIAVKLILMAFPSMPVAITPEWRLMAALMAVAGGLLGALYPAFKAAQLDPVKALGYE